MCNVIFQKKKKLQLLVSVIRPLGSRADVRSFNRLEIGRIQIYWVYKKKKTEKANALAAQ